MIGCLQQPSFFSGNRMMAKVLLCSLLLHTIGVLTTTTTGVSAESSTTKLRERVIELEDARDSLQSKYDRIVSEYKTLKGEIRSEIECQKSLDEAYAKLAEVDKRKQNVGSLEKELQRCSLQRENMLVDLHLTESSLLEAMKKYRDLERDVRKEDCSMIKRELVAYRDQAEQCLMVTESTQKKNGELVRQVEDQQEKLKELTGVEESLRSTRNELDLTKIRLAAVEGDAETLKVVEKEYVKVQNELASTVAALESSRNELNATKTALNSLLESLDSRLQYESLKDEHEKEILPYWLNSVVQRAAKNISILYQSSVQPWIEYVYDLLREIKLYVRNQIGSFHDHLHNTAQTLLHPMVLKADSMIFSHASVKRYRDKVLVFINGQSLRVKMQIVSVRDQGRIVKAGVVQFLQARIAIWSTKIPALRYVDNDTAVYAIFNAMVAAMVIPLGLFILNASFKGIVYYLRAGTVQIHIANAQEAVSILEESIDYKFSRRDYAMQALEQSPSLHQVGLALINLILAEQGNDSAKTLAELKHRSSRTCINTIVQPGPGRKSIQVAAQQKVYMYVCLLAAVFRDSEESVEQVFKVWNSTSTRPIPSSVPSTEDSCRSSSQVEDKKASQTSSSASPLTSDVSGEDDDEGKSSP